MRDLKLNDQQIEAYTLLELESMMQKLGKSLRDVEGMPLPDPNRLKELGNRLINEELNYDHVQLKQLHDQSFNSLNSSQKLAYEAIIDSVDNESGNLFFVSGHGGTGKTFLFFC